MWKLSYFDKGEKVLQKYPSGDAAKQGARRHQIGLGFFPTYRIYEPNGKIWMDGKAQITHNGFRMKWHYPKYRHRNK